MKSKFAKYRGKEEFHQFASSYREPEKEILIGFFGDPGSGKSHLSAKLWNKILYFALENNIHVTVFEANADKDLPPV